MRERKNSDKIISTTPKNWSVKILKKMLLVQCKNEIQGYPRVIHMSSNAATECKIGRKRVKCKGLRIPNREVQRSR